MNIPITKSRSIDVVCIPELELNELIANEETNLFGLVNYGKDLSISLPKHCLQIKVDLPQVGDSGLVEVWTTDLPCKLGNMEYINYSYNSDFIFASISVPENVDSDLENITRKAYADLLSLLDEKGYPHLIRIWNYFSDINVDQGGSERYKQFCAGRSKAFYEKYNVEWKQFPAANAVGTHKGALTIYLLASRKKASHLENPRQVSAYMYPKKYGKRSPSFARATYKDWGNTSQFFISGTASIVGHESRHENDLIQQIHEINRNMKSLLDAQFPLYMNEEGNPYVEDMAMAKIYLRDPDLYSVIKDTWENTLGWIGPSIYLVGDICRRELLLEIEGIWRARY
jgi:chorismate lyase/3-hydroxybenzoate synthase